MEPRKQAIIDALTRFMNQRSGIEFGNYGDVKAFRAEQRSIYTDLKHARVLLAAVKWRDGITADVLIKAAEGAFSGRLTVRLHFATSLPSQIDCDTPPPIASIDYVTGQYFPTEYRRAVCAVLASALWDYTREHAMPAVFTYKGGLNDVPPANMTAGDWLRAYFRKEFGRSIAGRWFT